MVKLKIPGACTRRERTRKLASVTAAPDAGRLASTTSRAGIDSSTSGGSKTPAAGSVVNDSKGWL